MINDLNSGCRLSQCKIRGVWHVLGLRETNDKASVGYNSKNERKDGFLRVNSSNAKTEL